MTEFNIASSRLEKISLDMVSDMVKGLTNENSSLLMLPTYIHNLPTGNESGNFLALDFGGSTFRVIHLELIPGKEVAVKSTTVSMESSMKEVSGEELFAYLAFCLSTFLQQENVSGKDIPLGFTFSFPMMQSSLAIGTLVRWTKGFQNPDVVGVNVATLLQNALLKNKETENIKVVALANDTAGTQVAGAVRHRNCHAGLILGTGTNAAYTEKVSNVAALEGCTEENVVINIEWGNFGEFGQLADIQTKYDRTLDDHSENPGKQLFEKMISGLYIGECVRLALLDRAENKTMLDGNVPEILTRVNTFDGAVVSKCISDEGYVKQLLQPSSISSQDVQTVQMVCQAVSVRAAKLAAAGVKAIWLKREKAEMTVAVDGSVFTKHCTFASDMKSALRDMGCHNVTLEVVSDGSGLGAALIAANAVQ